MSLSFLTIPALLITCLVCATVQAKPPSDSERASARAMMLSGYEKMEQRDFSRARDDFRAADALMNVPTTAYALALSELGLGNLVEAHEALIRVARMPEQGVEPEEFVIAREKAAELQRQVRARIPLVRVQVTGVHALAELVVLLDGQGLARASLGRPRLVNPGRHVIVARIGAEERRSEIDLDEGATLDVHLRFTPKAIVAHAVPSNPSGGSSDSSTSTSTVLTTAGVVVAAAGIVGGLVTGGLALSARGAAEDAGCHENQCPPAAHADADRARSLALLSTISFAVAGAGGALAVSGALLPSPHQRQTGVGGARVQLTGHF